MTDRIFEASAPLYWAASLPVIPLRERDKMPAIRSWTEFATRMPGDAEKREWLGAFPTGNIGLPLGPTSGIGVIDVDTDDQELIDAIIDMCGFSPWRRIGKKGVALAYRFDGQANFKLRAADGGMICEFLGQGNQVVLPPSIHPDTGQPYTANTNLWEVLDDLTPLSPGIEYELRAVLTSKGVKFPTPSRSKPPQSSSAEAGRYSMWLDKDVKRRAKIIEKTAEGDRNNALFREAAGMANNVAAAGADWAYFAAVLHAAGTMVGLPDAEIESTLRSAWEKGAETPSAWIEVSKEWIYLGGPDAFRHIESEAVMKPRSFATEFERINPDKEVSFPRFLTVNGLIEMVQDVAYDPRRPLGVFELNGRKWFNTYEPSSVMAKEGDPTPFIRYMEHLVPDPMEREHLTKMIAHLVRNPGQKLGHALILGSKVHGVGKSTLVSILTTLMGPRNCRKATSDELASQYQSYLDGKLLVTVEELDLGSGPRVYNKLKDMITAETSPVRRLYENTREIENLATFMFLTNLTVPLMIEPSDRRFFVIQSPAETLPSEYWEEFNRWWRSSPGIIRWYLDQVDLSDFKRFAPPPMTDAKAALIEKSQNPIVQDLVEMIEERVWPFHVDIVTRSQVQDALKRRHPQLRRNQIDAAMDDIGAVALGQHRLPEGAKRHSVTDTAAKPSLWAIRHRDFWSAAEPQQRVEEYLAHESTLAGIPEFVGIGLLPMKLLGDGYVSPRKSHGFRNMLELVRARSGGHEGEETEVVKVL